MAEFTSTLPALPNSLFQGIEHVGHCSTKHVQINVVWVLHLVSYPGAIPVPGTQNLTKTGFNMELGLNQN
jgi:hypothetical protein